MFKVQVVVGKDVWSTHDPKALVKYITNAAVNILQEDNSDLPIPEYRLEEKLKQELSKLDANLDLEIDSEETKLYVTVFAIKPPPLPVIH